jgi:hypothetical protein
MPTGYTAAVQDGTITDFSAFAFQCARAFGALIEMREDAPDAPVPESFTPSSYHADRLAVAKNRLEAVHSMTVDECQLAATAEYNAAKVQETERTHKRSQERDRYQAMLAEATAWTPPTSEHAGLKKFMMEQLEESIKFDCGDYSFEKTVWLSGGEWLAKEIAKVTRDIDYHAKENIKELERTASRNTWIRELRESFATGSTRKKAKS